MITYPLNRFYYNATDAELFHCTRNSGIYAGDDFVCTVTGADNNVTIGTGIGWIRNSKFSGKVVANKSDVVLDLSISDPRLNRRDVIAIQFDKNNNATNIVVKHGIAASEPTRPEIVQTEILYELYLAEVYRKAGATTITASDVTDLRLDPVVCGLMADSVTSVDTTAIDAQVKSLIEDLRAEISGVEDGTEIMLKSAYDPDYDGVIEYSKHSEDTDLLNKVFNGVKRKLLSIIGTIKETVSDFEDYKRNDNCRVSAVSIGKYVAMYCNNGSNRFNVRLNYGENSVNQYEIYTLKGWQIARSSLYSGSSNVEKNFVRLNIDGVYYNDFSVLETVGFSFRNLILQHTITENNAFCYVTLILNSNGFKIVETTSDNALLALSKEFVTSLRAGNIKPIVKHNNVMLFDIGTSTKPSIEKIEDYGNTVIKTIDFVGVI